MVTVEAIKVKQMERLQMQHSSVLNGQSHFLLVLGGIAVTNNPEIASKLRIESDFYPYPDIKEKLILWMLLHSYDFIMKPAIYWLVIKTYRFLSKVGFVTGSSSGEELVSPVKPEGFEKRMARFQQKRAMQEMEKFEENLNHRLRIAKRYDAILMSLGLKSLAGQDMQFIPF